MHVLPYQKISVRLFCLPLSIIHSLSLLELVVALSEIMETTAVVSGGGGLQEIPNAKNDPELHSLAVFAVDQYNSQKGLRLRLLEVVSAEQQVVAGIMYYLVIKSHLIVTILNTLKRKSGNKHGRTSNLWRASRR
ncbi:hypothetical protein KP509_30G020900 [Ceratopteris richardii]|uniref:Cysteine proteinase inhibitor n=1 Tax=Ceratopteris richardii TaxID=49495 RepID=A0A8T2R212_CERRI|nr:hypothetical protein KP509_30G020900 [Ceratopteris richardii]